MDFKLYVRDQSNETYVAAPRGPYALEIIDPTGETVHTVADITLSDFGAYSGSYAIPQTASVGWYLFQLTAEVHDARRADRSCVSPCACSSAISRRPRSVSRRELNGDLFAAGDDVVARPRARRCSRVARTWTPRRASPRRSNSKSFRSKHPVATSFTFGNTGQVAVGRRVAVRRARERSRASSRISSRFRPTSGIRMLYGTLSVEGAVRDDRGKYVASGARVPISSPSIGSSA